MVLIYQRFHVFVQENFRYLLGAFYSDIPRDITAATAKKIILHLHFYPVTKH